MNANSISFTLRDYLSYIFSGTIILLAIFMFDKRCNQGLLWSTIGNDTKVISLILIVGGYYLGYLSNVIMTYLVGPPYQDTLLSSQKYLDEKFVSQLKVKLKKYWTEEIYNNEGSNIVYLCWQDIQSTNHKGLNQIYRIISLRNFCVSSILPFCLLGFSLLISGHYIIGFMVLPMSFIMDYARKNQEKFFVQAVYRNWYIKRGKNVRK
jgi:hypothetical protein